MSVGVSMKSIYLKKVAFMEAINSYIKTLSVDEVIISRIDRDDCVNNNFVDIVQKIMASESDNVYIDTPNIYTYDTSKDEMFKTTKYNKMVSPFVSVKEKVKNGKIICYPYAYDHSTLNRYIKGYKNDKLIGVQVIHGNNQLNKICGVKIKCNNTIFGI